MDNTDNYVEAIKQVKYVLCPNCKVIFSPSRLCKFDTDNRFTTTNCTYCNLFLCVKPIIDWKKLIKSGISRKCTKCHQFRLSHGKFNQFVCLLCKPLEYKDPFVTKYRLVPFL